MRKNICCKVAAVLMAVITVGSMTACAGKTANGNNSTNEQGVGETTADSTSTDAASTENTQTTEPEKPTMEHVVAANAANVVGISSRGYAIQKINGATYINGILMVNKSYPLPSTYAPDGLEQQVLDAFYEMQADAIAEGLNIWIQSSYRSYDYQVSLYNSYVAMDGKAMADTYSARAGYSEHQSGLCFDLNSIDDTFTNTPEGRWVDQHAHEYGFIIRFPLGKEDITGYKYESWHLRYVGVEIATMMHDNNECLEEFLGVTSQYAD